MIDDATAEQFWARVDRSGGPDACWFMLVRKRLGFRGLCTVRAPVTVRLGDRSMLAHQAAYTLMHGPVPLGLVVRHRCAMTGCVNPAHLLLGTQRENILDIHARRRRSIARGDLFTYEDDE